MYHQDRSCARLFTGHEGWHFAKVRHDTVYLHKKMYLVNHMQSLFLICCRWLYHETNYIFWQYKKRKDTVRVFAHADFLGFFLLCVCVCVEHDITNTVSINKTSLIWCETLYWIRYLFFVKDLRDECTTRTSLFDRAFVQLASSEMSSLLLSFLYLPLRCWCQS